MAWEFNLGGKRVSYTIAEKTAAVRPIFDLRDNLSHFELSERYGKPLTFDLEKELSKSKLALQNRDVFERAGWLFVKAADELMEVADLRTELPGTEAVSPVFTSPSGEVMLGTDRVTIQVSGDASETEALKQLQQDSLSVIRALRFAPNTFEVRLPPGTSLPETIDRLQGQPETYTFAEPQLLQFLDGRMTPTDPEFGNQWQHRNDGSNGGSVGAHIHSEAAWEITRGHLGDRPTRIAVIDNGMDIAHPDIKGGIVGGGYFYPDGVGGATLIKLQAGSPFPRGRTNHGTFCMGMAGARMNNDSGGCGSAPEADLLAISCLEDQVGSQATLARAIAYAANPTREDSQASAADGADIISCSLGPSIDWDIHSVLDLAIHYAATQGRNGLGVPIFWAVSNYPLHLVHNDPQVSSRDDVCSHPDVIAVGRSNRTDSQDGSAFGSRLAFLAPGRRVFAMKINNLNPGFCTGTSFAAPLAAGVGALLLSCHPELTASEVRDRLCKSCDKIPGPLPYDDEGRGRNDFYGFGRLNAAQALQ